MDFRTVVAGAVHIVVAEDFRIAAGVRHIAGSGVGHTVGSGVDHIVDSEVGRIVAGSGVPHTVGSEVGHIVAGFGVGRTVAVVADFEPAPVVEVQYFVVIGRLEVSPPQSFVAVVADLGIVVGLQPVVAVVAVAVAALPVVAMLLVEKKQRAGLVAAVVEERPVVAVVVEVRPVVAVVVGRLRYPVAAVHAV